MTTEPGFAIHDGELHCDGVALRAIAEAVGTPAYVYAGRAIDAAYRAVDEALSFAPHLVCYAVKASSNLALLARLASMGAGADIVSGGELARCLRAGMPAERIVWSGVGKTDEEIHAAITSDIRSVHVESVAELEAIDAAAAALGRTVRVALRINPDVDPHTHPYIATGLHHTKFGLELDVARNRALPLFTTSENLVLDGIACHIGSQIGDTTSVEEAVAITGRFFTECRALGLPLRTVDAGGGWPIPYGDETTPYPEARAFGEAIERGLEAADLRSDVEVLVEPGRALVGAAAVLLTRVAFVKEQPYRPDAVADEHAPPRATKRFVIVDAAMNDLIRPSLYGAYHDIVPVHAPRPDAPREAADVVGPVCETGDFFAEARTLPPVARGDLLAITCAGAYGMSMASNYNSRPRAPEVLVDGDTFRVIRDRETHEDLWRGERI